MALTIGNRIDGGQKNEFTEEEEEKKIKQRIIGECVLFETKIIKRFARLTFYFVTKN